MREALLQPVELTEEIMLQRTFVRVLEKSRTAPADMSPEEWDFLEAIDLEVNGPDAVHEDRIVRPLDGSLRPAVGADGHLGHEQGEDHGTQDANRQANQKAVS